MRYWIGIGALLAIMLAGASLPVWAGEGDVAVGGTTILRVRFATPGMTIQQRADAITERVTKILSQGVIKPQDIQVKTVKKETVLMVGKELLITVDKATADYNKATPQQLAEMWAKHLREVLPQLTPQKDGQERL